MARTRIASSEVIGQRFGRLIVKRVFMAPYGRGGRTHSVAECACDCGSVKPVNVWSLLSGSTRSCGCLQSEVATVLGRSFRTHGGTLGRSPTPEYTAWVGMKERCLNPRTDHYDRYGGRGIEICDRWANSFEDFLADMGRKPSPKHSLDRIDNNSGYYKENCRWATHREQMRNRSSNVIITFGGITATLVEWSERVGIGPETLRERIWTLGWGVEKALSTPLRVKGKL